MNKQKENYLATLLGCALGDALGMPVEGWKRAQIKKYVGKITEFREPMIIRDGQGNKIIKDEFGKLGYYTEGLAKGEYTDDTILTLALAESIAEKRGLDLNDIARKQLAAFEEHIQPGANGQVRGGFGTTTRLGLENIHNGISPLKSGVIGGPGNAPAMKMSPLGLYMHASGEYENGLRFAEKIGRITHLDPRSLAGGVVQAHAISVLLGGISREQFVDSLVAVCQKYEKPATEKFPLYDKGNLFSRLEWLAEHRNVDSEEAFAHLRSSSLSFSSHPFALFMFQKYWDQPVEGLIETVNHGGDCDTTGAIYGALCGAKNGLIFPEKWLSELQGKERLIKAARGIYELRGK